MNIQEFVDLNKRLGHRVLATKRYFWLVREDATALSIPTLENAYPDESELNQLFSRGVKVAVFKSDLLKPNSYEYLFSGARYSLDQFDSKIRNQIRKGLKDCAIAEASIEDLIEYGFSINTQTLNAQGRSVKYLSEKCEWADYVAALKGTKDVAIKGAFIQKKLVAYAVFMKVLDKHYIYHPFMDKAYSNACPMNGILYSFVNEVLEKEGAIQISYGLASYTERSGLDKFKKGMLFTASECSRVAVMGPRMRMFVNRAGLAVASLLSKSGVVDEVFCEKYKYLLASKAVQREYFALRSKSDRVCREA